MRWTDNHCHLEPDTLSDVVARAAAAGVERMIDVGTDLATSRAAVAKANADDRVWATVGVHPHEARHGIEGIEDLLGSDRVVAVGECGLDYHYNHSSPADQQAVFAAQIEMAHRHEMPLVIHSREAWDDTFAVLDEHRAPDRTVFHCFTGGVDEARSALDRGAMLSFSGIVSFPSADDVREAAALCPLDRLLVETDSPYLAPVPRRGRPNSPANLPLVGEALALAKNLAPEVVAERTWVNAAEFYRLDP
ncbi:TatD family hydrolase [Candidatus Poriferisocius sp.]|uniref:TatD family hydrolase n=1 Tax=Candidatus Poriferisocius sp. TaxID=3101276 RepID=UPI003B5BE022